MASVRKSLLFSFAATYATTALTFVSSVIVARLLTPKQIGIYSISAALIAIAHQVRGMGLAAYLVQEKELTKDRLATAFGILLAVSWTLAVAIACSSVPAARFYGEPAIGEVMRVLALSFVLIPFGGITITMLSREMKIGARSTVDFVSVLFQVATAVTLAYLGFEHMSLAWGSLAGVAASVCAASFFRPSHLPWLPSFREWRRVLSYGLLSTGSGLINNLKSSATELIVGRVLGAEAVGLLSRAAGLTTMFSSFLLSAVSRVAFPYFAKQHREGYPLGNIFTKVVELTTGIAWPVFACVAVLSEPIIIVLFGEQWHPSVPLARVVCLAAGILVPFWYWSMVLNALGKAKVILVMETVALVVGASVTLLLAPLGLKFVAWGGVVVGLPLGVINWWVLRRSTGLSLRTFLVSLGRSIGVTLAAAAGPVAVVALLSTHTVLWIQLVLGLGFAGAGWIIGIFVCGHPLAEEIKGVFRTAATRAAKWFNSGNDARFR